jgi:hypothetical protein
LAVESFTERCFDPLSMTPGLAEPEQKMQDFMATAGGPQRDM